MRRAVVSWALVAAVLVTFTSVDAPARRETPRIWFCPGPGTLDFVRLFNAPQEWSQARRIVSVFKFYQQHTLMPPDQIVGPNTYDAFARAGVFRQVKQWNIETAIEVASVKEHYCTPDARGMNEAIAATIASVRAVEAAGGSVSYLAMDEPFVSGRARVCDGPALEPTADRVATYVNGVRSTLPDVKIGLIEAYPFSTADQLETALQLLKARNAMPAFLHMDVDWVRSGPDDYARDMKRLQGLTASLGIQFGEIITGTSGDADALYAADAYTVAELLAGTFQTWDRMPDHLIFQSWARSSNGLLITPANLPISRPFTHTNLIVDIFRRLRGSVGGSTGTAIPRRR